jgi:hypothetical protein
MSDKPMTPEEMAWIAWLEILQVVTADGLQSKQPERLIAAAIREAEDRGYQRGAEEERERCAEETSGDWARLVWWGPGYGDGVAVEWFSGPPAALDAPYLKQQLADALEDATDLFGIEKPPRDTEEGWPMESVCRVELEEPLYDDSHGPRLLVDPGGYYLMREPNPPSWIRSALPTTQEDGTAPAGQSGVEA